MTALLEIPGLDSETSTEQKILRAWRRLARARRPDKTASYEARIAKEACLEAIVNRTCAVGEREFVLHIARLTEKKLRADAGLDFNIEIRHIIQPFLREHMAICAVDAMQWVLHCAIGEWDFDQAVENDVPILCRYYNEFLGSGEWTEDDQTIMAVLNRYGEIKANGYGNFARFLETSAEQGELLAKPQKPHLGC